MVCSVWHNNKKMNQCELCDFPARMHCESDQASLCWNCDAKVHSANFLVARHSRTLLCQVCQSETSWRTTGAKLGPTVSVCHACMNTCNERHETQKEEDEGESDDIKDEEEEEDDDDSEDQEEEEEEDGENQVVPLSSTPLSFNSAPVASSSREEFSGRLCNDGDSQMEMTTAVSLKRLRENADPGSQEDGHGSSPFQANPNQNQNEDDDATSYGPSRPSKERKKTSSVLESIQSIADSKSALIETLKKIQEEKRRSTDDSVTVFEICKLSKDHRPIDVVSSGSESPPS